MKDFSRKSKQFLTPQEAHLFLELTQECLSITSEDEFKTLINYKLGQLLDSSVFSHTLMQQDDFDFGEDINFFNVHSVREDWFEQYTAQQYEQVDTTIPFALSHINEAHTWEQAFQFQPSPKFFISEAEDAGLKKGIIIATQSFIAPYNRSIISLSGNIETDSRTKFILEAIMPHLHNAIQRVASNEHENIITERQKSVLSLIEQGYSRDEIAEILCTTRSNVNFHLKNIFNRLHATTSAQAVSNRYRQGVIIDKF